jgi:hypothetical protein
MKQLDRLQTAYLIDVPRRSLTKKIKGHVRIWRHHLIKAKCTYKWPDGSIIF